MLNNKECFFPRFFVLSCEVCSQEGLLKHLIGGGHLENEFYHSKIKAEYKMLLSRLYGCGEYFSASYQGKRSVKENIIIFLLRYPDLSSSSVIQIS